MDDIFKHHKPTHTSSIVITPPPTHTGHTGLVFPTNLSLQFIGKAGQVSLWVFFIIFFCATIGVGLIVGRVEKRARVFHANFEPGYPEAMTEGNLSALTLSIATMGYFAMATGVGSIGPDGADWGHRIGQPWRPHHAGRPIPPSKSPKDPGSGVPVEQNTVYARQHFWVHDVAHAATASILIFVLGILSRMPPILTLTGMFAAFFSSVSIAFASLVSTGNQRPHLGKLLGWGLMSDAWMLVVFWIILLPGVNAVRRRSSRSQGIYYMLVVLSFVSWVAYAVNFILGPALNVWSVNVETIITGVVDVFGIIGFVYFLLATYTHDDNDDCWLFPDWFVEAAESFGSDGRGTYAAAASE